MAKREKRPTRAQKIERSRAQAIELRIFQSKPWWPEKAHTEEEAVTKIYHRLLEFDQIAGVIELAQEQLDLHAFLKAIPEEYINKAKQRIENEERRERALEEADDGDYEEPPLFPDGYFLAKSNEELNKLVEILCNEQGMLGEARYIDDRKVERVEAKIRLVQNELKRRETNVAA